MIHGTIEINGHFIAEWRANRATNTDQGPLHPDTVCDYEWYYFTPVADSVGGTLRHRFGDGAPILASKVLAAAAEAMEEGACRPGFICPTGCEVYQDGP